MSTVLGFTYLAFVFFVGYRMGSQAQMETAAERAAALRGREGAIRDLIDKCEVAVSAAEVQVGEVTKEMKALKEKKVSLKDNNKELYRDNQKLEDENAKCIEEGEQARQQWTETDEKNQKELTALRERLTVITDQSKHLESAKGMWYVVLSQAVRKARAQNFNFRGVLKLGSPPEHYEKNLTARWKGVSSRLHLSTNELATPPPEWKPFVFDSATTKGIFTQEKKDGAYSRPEWHGYVGSQNVTRGTSVLMGLRASQLPRMDLANVVRMIQEYTMCAFRNAAPNFTFPEKWLRRGTNRSLALVNNSEIIDTPLITFCTDCSPMASDDAFRYACLGDTIQYLPESVPKGKNVTNPLYGSLEFWQMRSRIRWYGKHLKQAEAYANDNELAGKKYVSLLLRHTETLNRRCKAVTSVAQDGTPASPMGRELYHSAWLRANFGKDTTDSLYNASDLNNRCMPVNGFKDALGSFLDGFEAVYVSVHSTDRDTDAAMIAALKEALGDKKVVIAAPSTIDEDIVDVIVASQGAGLVANRYCDHSSVVTEEFLMNAKFNADNIRLW
jgi:Skp family chaperone for outer membrane proteins